MGAFVWHPTNPSVAWSFGGDFLTRSTDGAATWTWSNHGYTGIMTGHAFNFHVTRPDVLYLPSQDYDGALTADAGNTWQMLSFSGHHWGGFTYGGYAVNEGVVVAGSRESWDGPTEIRVADLKAGTVKKTGLHIEGETVAYGAPLDASTVFYGNFRSVDLGRTWQPMDGCRGVYAHHPGDPRQLFGLDGDRVVCSTDHGATWNEVATIEGQPPRDLAVDPKRGVLYIANREGLHRVDCGTGEVTDITSRLPADRSGTREAWSVAVDPVEPDIVYACRPANVYMSDASVFRSTDAGRTWQILTRGHPESVVTTGPDGGREAYWVRVHPGNRHAYFGTVCFGLWRIAPPTGGLTSNR